MKVAVHLRAEVFDTAKQQIQDNIMSKIGEPWDFPDQTGKGGTSTTGNTARKILHHNIKLVIEMLPERFQAQMETYGQQLSVIIKDLSSNKKIGINKYKDLCTQVYVDLIESFPGLSAGGSWVSITPSLHKLLAHSWEFIEMNRDQGLRSLDESGLEGNNKLLRRIRTKLSRKTSQDDNLVDTLRRMWVGSDPSINLIRMKAQPKCKFCNVTGHSTRYCKIRNNNVTEIVAEDDKLFESILQ